MVSSGYLHNAPFDWVTISLRYGLKNEDKPYYQKISKKYEDLPLSIELDTRELIEADRNELRRLFTLAALKCNYLLKILLGRSCSQTIAHF
jgi:hypothetical protein